MKTWLSAVLLASLASAVEPGRDRYDNAAYPGAVREKPAPLYPKADVPIAAKEPGIPAPGSEPTRANPSLQPGQPETDSLQILDLALVKNHIWLVTAQGSILHSADRGITWERQQPDRFDARQPPGLRQVQFLDTARGFVAGARGAFLRTRDGGRTWEARRVGETWGDFQVLHFLDSTRGLLVDHAGSAFATRDGGQNWEAVKAPLAPYRDAAAGKGAGEAWVFLAGAEGRVAAGPGWRGLGTPKEIPGRPDLQAIHFRDTLNGLAAGADGLLARTRDGGITWDTVRLRAGHRILDLDFLDRKQGFAVGEKGLLFETRDGGGTWLRASRSPAESGIGSYLRFPPPGYFVLLIMLLALVWPVVRTPRVEIVQESIADQLVSDRPLEDDRFDVLGLGRKADALAAFLGNPRTEPPLTFGIMGEWGKGKSSLMNLLRNRLGRDGFTTVWFNAWHHQSEESLLASLLETIRRTRIAPWWTLDGIRFRLNLLFKRVVHGRETDWVLLLSGVVAFLILCRWNPLGLEWNFASVEAFLQGLEEGTWGSRMMGMGGTLVTALPLGLSALTFWKMLRRALVVFDANPSRLLADAAGRATLRDMSAKVGFREEFRREFLEVAEALRHAPLVIFIDDLDRCQPGKVMEILESINFLVTCGPCYFVVAMDKRQITRAIIVHDDSVIRMFNDRGEAHAQEYLEKIINIEVPVPEPGPDAYKQMMTLQDVPSTLADRSGENRRWQEALKNLPLFLVLGFMLYLSGALLRAPTDSGTTKAGQAPATVASPNSVSMSRSALEGFEAATGLTATGSVGSLPFAWEAEAPFFESGRQAPWTRPFAVAIPTLAGALLAWAALAWFFQRRRRHFRDSADFIQAVDAWHPLIFLGAKTPRAVKKFLNRLRFFAVLRRNPGTGGTLEVFLGDGDLVALASVELGVKNLLEGEAISLENLKKFEAYLREKHPDSPLPNRLQLCAHERIWVLF